VAPELIGETLVLHYAPGVWADATLTVRAENSVGLFVEDTFEIVATAPPLVDHDYATTPVDQAIDVDVLGNDSARGRGMDPTTVAIAQAAAHGDTDVDPVTGVITYTPAAGFYGEDAFTYAVNDDDGRPSGAAIVTVVVNAAPELLAPIPDVAVDMNDPDAVVALGPHFDDPDYDGTHTFVDLDTALGHIYLELADGDTPLNVANFLNYVNDGDFDNTVFNRLEQGFALHGGSYGAWSPIPTDSPVVDEPGISNTRGTIGMNHNDAGDADSATTSWYINLDDNSAYLDAYQGGLTVFGRVILNGMDVVDAWSVVPTRDFGGIWDQLPLLDYTEQDFADNAPILDENIPFLHSANVVNELSFTAVSSDPSLVVPTVVGGALTLDFVGQAYGTATITVQARDLVGTITETTFTVSVKGAPLPTQDEATTAKDTPVDVDVLANDAPRVTPIDPTTVVVTDGPANGAVDVDPVTGVVTYTPNAGFVGRDTFTYTVDNTLGDTSETGLAIVRVTGDPIVIGEGGIRTLKFYDADGTLVTITHSGPGTAAVTLGGYPGAVDPTRYTFFANGAELSIFTIDFSDTTIRSSLTIRTSRGAVPGATVGTVTGDSLVGAFKAASTDVVDRGILMTGDGAIANVYARNVVGGADIEMPGAAPSGVKVVLASVTDAGTDMDFASHVRYMSLRTWVGSNLTAPWVTKFIVTGHSGLAIAGDLLIHMNLSGVGAPGHTLGYVSVADDILGGLWAVNGSVGTIIADNTAPSWALDAAGGALNISMRSDLEGALSAEWFGITRGNRLITATLTASGADAKGVSFRLIRGGVIQGSVVTGPGGITKVYCVDWYTGSIATAWMRTFITTGSRSLSLAGDAYLDITLAGHPNPLATTLNYVDVAGLAVDGVWAVHGSVGSVNLDGSTPFWTFTADGSVRLLASSENMAGDLTALWFGTARSRRDWTADLTATGANAKGVSIGLLKAGHVGDVAVEAPGGIRTVKVFDWDDGSVTADWIDSFTTTGHKGLKIEGSSGV
ncbi:peptidylprolyl isomerase, partial [bacterium]|nr:peptidylprolyl isomerase [bacterium]